MTQADFPPERAPRQAPIALWRFARLLICELHALFGAPEDIARSAYVTRAAHKLMTQWIGAAESLLRRLLFIEAKAILAHNAPAPAPRHARITKRTKRLVVWRQDKPEEWRVSFRLMDRRRPRRPAPAQAAEAPPRHTPVHDTWPLALRCEALLRVFNDPIPHARRLARRLTVEPSLTPRAVSLETRRIVGGRVHWDEADALCASPPPDRSSAPADTS